MSPLVDRPVPSLKTRNVYDHAYIERRRNDVRDLLRSYRQAVVDVTDKLQRRQAALWALITRLAWISWRIVSAPFRVIASVLAMIDAMLEAFNAWLTRHRWRLLFGVPALLYMWLSFTVSFQNGVSRISYDPTYVPELLGFAPIEASPPPPPRSHPPPAPKPPSLHEELVTLFGLASPVNQDILESNLAQLTGKTFRSDHDVRRELTVLKIHAASMRRVRLSFPLPRTLPDVVLGVLTVDDIDAFDRHLSAYTEPHTQHPFEVGLGPFQVSGWYQTDGRWRLSPGHCLRYAMTFRHQGYRYDTAATACIDENEVFDVTVHPGGLP